MLTYQQTEVKLRSKFIRREDEILDVVTFLKALSELTVIARLSCFSQFC